jgi:hypothetical protein
MNKYRNKPVVIDGQRFASKHEARVYGELCILRDWVGTVESFKCQVPIKFIIHGVKVCTYIADFVVWYKDGTAQIIDAKGIRTREYLTKKKLVKAYYGIDIIEK